MIRDSVFTLTAAELKTVESLWRRVNRNNPVLLPGKLMTEKPGRLYPGH